jgi:hypothetical protein
VRARNPGFPQLTQSKKPGPIWTGSSIEVECCDRCRGRALCVSCLPCRGHCNSNLPPVFPIVERRALPAILEPTIAVTARLGAAPSGSAPSVGSRPPDPDGRTRGGTTEGTAAPSIPAAPGANRTWFGNRLLRTRTTGFSLGCCGRSISGLSIAIRVWLSISDLSRDNDRADDQDRSHDTTPHSVPSTPRLGTNSPWW